MPTNLKDLALIGARARLQQIQQETDAIRATFPQLFRGSNSSPVRKNRTAAQRKTQSLRMKAFWAERKKAATAAKARQKANKA